MKKRFIPVVSYLKSNNAFIKSVLLIGGSILFSAVLAAPTNSNVLRPDNPGYLLWETKSLVKDSIDKNTGLLVSPGHELVLKNCLRCHSPQLITNKRASREGWLATIRWMQQTQGLPDLGKDEPLLLDYLAKNYAPTYEGRRPRLKNIEWYKLD